MTVWYYGLKCKFNICSYCSLNDRRYWHAKNIFSFINMKNYKITEIFNIDQCFALTIFFFILGDRRNSQSNSIGSDASSPPDSPYGSQYLNPPTGTCHYIAISWTIVYKKWSSNYLYSDCWNCLFYKKQKPNKQKTIKVTNAHPTGLVNIIILNEPNPLYPPPIRCVIVYMYMYCWKLMIQINSNPNYKTFNVFILDYLLSSVRNRQCFTNYLSVFCYKTFIV